jgi:hypothetical protein
MAPQSLDTRSRRKGGEPWTMLAWTGASPPGFGLGVEITCRVGRPRDPRKPPLYGLLESLYERVSRAVCGKAASQGFAAGGVPRSSWSPSPASGEECVRPVAPSGRRSSPPSSRTRSWSRWAMPSGHSRSPTCCRPYRAALRRRWAETDPPRLRSRPPHLSSLRKRERVIGFITQPALIDRILDHLRRRDKIPRPPPLSAQPLATPA